MKNKINLSIKILVFFLAFVGIFTISNITHELKHYYDLKDITEVTEVCLLNLPLELLENESRTGYVNYLPNQCREFSSERDALIIDFSIIIILSFITFYYFFIQKTQ